MTDVSFAEKQTCHYFEYIKDSQFMHHALGIGYFIWSYIMISHNQGDLQHQYHFDFPIDSNFRKE